MAGWREWWQRFDWRLRALPLCAVKRILYPLFHGGGKGEVGGGDRQLLDAHDYYAWRYIVHTHRHYASVCVRSCSRMFFWSGQGEHVRLEHALTVWEYVGSARANNSLYSVGAVASTVHY